MTIGQWGGPTWPTKPIRWQNRYDGRAIDNLQSLPFAGHNWSQVEYYEGNYGDVTQVGFNLEDAVLIGESDSRQSWFVLLESKVFEGVFEQRGRTWG